MWDMKSSWLQFMRLRQGSEGKVVNVKAKALTVEKIVESKEQNKLRFEAANCSHWPL